MATQTGSYVCDNSTLANFQSWTSAIYSAFTTFGWVQTGDSGQAANPIAAVPSSAYVYWIFKANGSNASAMPIYVKVYLGYNSTTISFGFDVGTGSDGSGNITGVVISQILYPLGHNSGLSNHGATAYPSFFSGDADNIRLYMWSQSGAGLGWVFVIDRSKNSSGADTASYFTVCAISSQGIGTAQNTSQQTLSTTTTSLQRTGCATVTKNSTAGTGAANGTVAAYPVFPDFGQVGNPLIGLMSVYYGDVADGASVSVQSMYGSTHTYVVAKDSGSFAGFSEYASEGESARAALLMQYE